MKPITSINLLLLAAAITAAATGRQTLTATKPTERPILAASNVVLADNDMAAKEDVSICQGKQRWGVKTLQDRDASSVDFSKITDTTVHSLVNMPVPSHRLPQNGRLDPVETTLYRVHAIRLGYTFEDDRDLHVIISDPATGETMVAEIPAPECVSRFKDEFAAARKYARSGETTQVRTIYWLKKPEDVVVIGVGFYDTIHGRHLEVGGSHLVRDEMRPGHWVKGEEGAAPNAIELHPVILFRADPRGTK